MTVAAVASRKLLRFIQPLAPRPCTALTVHRYFERFGHHQLSHRRRREANYSERARFNVVAAAHGNFGLRNNELAFSLREAFKGFLDHVYGLSSLKNVTLRGIGIYSPANR